MLLSDGRELVGKLGPVDDGDDDYKKKDKDNDDNDDNNEEKNIDNSNNNDNDADDQETSAGSLPHFPRAGASPPQREPGAHMIFTVKICVCFLIPLQFSSIDNKNLAVDLSKASKESLVLCPCCRYCGALLVLCLKMSYCVQCRVQVLKNGKAIAKNL